VTLTEEVKDLYD
jgi:hypothetical protein